MDTKELLAKLERIGDSIKRLTPAPAADDSGAEEERAFCALLARELHSEVLPLVRAMVNAGILAVGVRLEGNAGIRHYAPGMVCATQFPGITGILCTRLQGQGPEFVIPPGDNPAGAGPQG
jgi:hypothetical protein